MDGSTRRSYDLEGLTEAQQAEMAAAPVGAELDDEIALLRVRIRQVNFADGVGPRYGGGWAAAGAAARLVGGDGGGEGAGRRRGPRTGGYQ
jgi:hypothetical protein